MLHCHVNCACHVCPFPTLYSLSDYLLRVAEVMVFFIRNGSKLGLWWQRLSNKFHPVMRLCRWNISTTHDEDYFDFQSALTRTQLMVIHQNGILFFLCTSGRVKNCGQKKKPPKLSRIFIPFRQNRSFGEGREVRRATSQCNCECFLCVESPFIIHCSIYVYAIVFA